MSEIELAGCVITDRQNRILLLHRRDHNQWQLPGGRREPNEVAAQAAIREVYEELGVVVNALHRVGTTAFRQGETDYFGEWFQVTQYDWEPYLAEPQTYDKLRYFNLLTRQIGRQAMSPNVLELARALHDGQVHLEPNTVQ